MRYWITAMATFMAIFSCFIVEQATRHLNNPTTDWVEVSLVMFSFLALLTSLYIAAVTIRHIKDPKVLFLRAADKNPLLFKWAEEMILLVLVLAALTCLVMVPSIASFGWLFVTIIGLGASAFRTAGHE